MKKVLVPLALIVVFALTRWPGLMPLNFSAAYAIVFCAGVFLPGSLGWVAPLAVLGVTDCILHFVFYRSFPFAWLQFFGTEAAYFALIALGRAFRGRRPFWMLVGGGLLGAVLFYFVTNTAAWLYLPGYQKNLAGWIKALTTGLSGYPQTWEFFRNTLTSGGLFTGLFVGVMKVTASEESEEEKKSQPEPESLPDPEKAEV